jgi:uncharacterized protein (DUF1697 family)
LIRQVALLRGINLGRAKRVAMADLRALFHDLGYRNTRTVLNSGNLIFVDPAGMPAETSSRIERALPERLGVSARVIVLTEPEFASIVKENPLLDIVDNPSRLLVMVLADPADRRLLEPLVEQDWSPEALALGSHAAYLWCPAGVLASRLPEAAGRLLGDAVTTRNWSTIMKISALLRQLEK